MLLVKEKDHSALKIGLNPKYFGALILQVALRELSYKTPFEKIMKHSGYPNDVKMQRADKMLRFAFKDWFKNKEELAHKMLCFCDELGYDEQTTAEATHIAKRLAETEMEGHQFGTVAGVTFMMLNKYIKKKNTE